MKWLEQAEPVLRLGYRIAVIGLLIWIGRLIKASDQWQYLQEIVRLLNR